MRLLKKYFNRENKFSLKERFNMVMTVVTCFFMGVMGENGRGMQGIKGLIGGILPIKFFRISDMIPSSRA